MEAEQQHDVNSAGHTVIGGRKGEGFVIAVLASAVPMNNYPKSIEE